MDNYCIHVLLLTLKVQLLQLTTVSQFSLDVLIYVYITITYQHILYSATDRSTQHRVHATDRSPVEIEVTS